ncbi:MAG: DNA mismatch repair endonuclease MutL [Myxococcales bacterium]|nr:DNA mismatch repair endonuclease MutL [Myxococcales bacterium]
MLGKNTQREIQVLPDVLVNQIAAGEVVERPASVVKELVENALDAGASHISIEIEGGGKTRIRVLDNGVGMSASAAELALQRHATSKLRAVEELFGLGTFGFRGEALPSIASVSKMTLTTRERGDGVIAANLLRIEGGIIVERAEVGAPVGTCIEICDLLYNVPARRKFLKGEATETSHITDVVSKLALANPTVHVRLKNRSRTTLNAPGHTNYADRVQAVMGTRLGAAVESVSGEYGGVRVRAFLAESDLAQSTTRGLQIFVGRRPIRDRGILHAIMQGYNELIPRGRYPVAVVLIDTPKADVDINVHPQKLEVRFSDPQLVYAAVRQVVRQGVADSAWGQARSTEAAEGGHMRVIASKIPPGLRGEVPQEASALAKSYAKEHAKLMLPWGRKTRDEAAPAPRTVRSKGSGPVSETVVPAVSSPNLAAKTEQSPQADVSPEPTHGTEFFSSLRYLGQLDRTYLLCEAEGELVMLDQHAAHERVELDKLLSRYRDGSMPVQKLLLPQTVALNPKQATAAEAHGEQLAALGFELDDFGDGGGTLSYALKSVPAGLLNAEPEIVLLSLLDELVRTGQGRAIDEIVENLLATVACHSVVRAGDTLGAQEVKSLLTAMDKVDFRGAAPHGRPVLLRIGIPEIARRFGR